MTVISFIVRVMAFLISLYFIVSEAYTLVHTELEDVMLIHDPLFIIISSLKFTLIFFVLPLLYLHKLLNYFEIPSPFGKLALFQTRLFHEVVYFIITILIVIRALEPFLAK